MPLPGPLIDAASRSRPRSLNETEGPAKGSLLAVGLGELELGAAVLIEEGMRDHVEAVG